MLMKTSVEYSVSSCRGFERGDALAVEIEAVIGLAQVDIELDGVEGRREFGAKVAVRLREDELVDLGQGLILVVVPELFDIGADALVEDDFPSAFQVHPAGLHLHLLIARHHTVVRLHHG